MKQFYNTNRHRIFQGLPSGLLISFLVYLFLRVMFHDFPMTWFEEIGFFCKVVLTGTVLIVLATGTSAAMHAGYKRVVRHRQAA